MGDKAMDCTKVCSTCKSTKDLSEFGKCKANADGLRGSCRICASEYAAKWNRDNRDKIREIKARWNKDNAELMRGYKQKWRRGNTDKIKSSTARYYRENAQELNAKTASWQRANPEKVKETQAKYRNKNPEAQRERSRNWRKSNPGQSRAQRAKRRAAKLQATPAWADLEAIKQFYIDCPEGYHVDHIHPLRGKDICGLHVLNNLQYLPAEENIRKGISWTNGY